MTGVPGEANAANVIIVKQAPGADSDFFTEFLRSRLGQSQILAGSVGGAQGVFNTQSAAKVVVAVPPHKEQKQISNVLCDWNAAIEKSGQLIAAREIHYIHELSRLFSQGKHPRGHVGHFAYEVSERNRGGNDERVLSVTNSRGFVLPEDQFERRVASADLSNYKVVTREQYAYNPSRINVGSIARLNDWDMGVLSPMYVVFRLDHAKVNSDYFLHWLDSHEARERIKKCAQGSVRETVSFTEFAAIAFPLPGLDRQAAIARYLNALREEISTLGAYVEKLKEQKRGLMQKLLTGQWRVPVKSKEATMSSFRFDEKHLSQIPALQLLANLGYRYLTPAEALACAAGGLPTCCWKRSCATASSASTASSTRATVSLQRGKPPDRHPAPEERQVRRSAEDQRVGL